MSSFKKQLLFILIAGSIITAGALIIKGATPSGFLKIKPSLTAKVKMVKQENATTSGNNPVGWWKMDEGTGQYAYDVSGNGNTGTLGTSTVADGADPTWATGKLGKGLSFDGSNDYVDTGDKGSTFNFSDEKFTLSAWIKTTATSGTIVAGYESAYWLFMVTDGKLNLLTWNSYTSVSSDGTVNDGKWHYVTVTANGTGNTANFYIDGVISGTNKAVANIPTQTSTHCYMGAYYASGIYSPFNGLIDDVRIYNRALSSSEVGQMYNSTKDGYLGKIKVSTGLVGYWKLDDNNVLTSVIDYSGKGNTGTAYSSTATSTSVLSTSTAMVGRAMSFDGVDDWVDMGSGSSLNIVNAITISAWVKMNTRISFATILFKGDKYVLLTQTSSIPKYYFILRDVDGGNNYAFMTSEVPLGQWVYISATWKKGDYLRIYYNGVQDGISTTILNKSIADTLANLLNIGRYGATGYYFNGLIDEVKIWNYARTSEQILQDYQRGLRGLP